ncbi:DUF4148 domain-containing protein [Paraburkholderia phenoliruptrix]|jgi:hypothetical protein|uniref:DUF4148 domain-containing protein n=1 Tax=Paraburkholderia phenoliruptrix TaxID=252970 RepID=UPI00158275B3|nr:DUF4148 domain-containing protein [Paraburkholderia phenoliruptrix]
MKVQLVATAVVFATLATSALADADHDYPKAATPAFVVKDSADMPASGWRAPGGRETPVGKTREQGQQRASQPQRDTIVPPETQTDRPGRATTERNRARQSRSGAAGYPAWLAALQTHSSFLSSPYAILCVE